MGKASIDVNRKPTAIGLGDDGVIYPFKTDPVTGRLLIDITPVAEPASPVFHTASDIDVNRKNVATGLEHIIQQDTSGNILPFHIDSRNNLLFCDILIE